MKVIYVKTTGTCNLNCSHCFTNGKSGDKTQFDETKVGNWIQEFMDKYPDTEDHHLEFHGGEPFLVPIEKLTALAERFHYRPGVSMGANSNLTFKISDEQIQFMKKYLHNSIGTSWDHWIRWGNQKQFDLWKSNVKMLTEQGIDVFLKVSVSKELIKTSPDWFIDQMESFGVKDVSLERLTVGGNSEENLDIFPNNEEQDNWYLALYLRYKERNPVVKIKTLDIIEQKLKHGVVKIDTNCRNCEQNLVTINSNGTLSGCPNMATQKPHAKLEDGVDVFLSSDGRLDEIVAELTWGDTCLTCDVFDLCGGDCHRLPWQGNRCGGLKNTLRYLSGRNQQSNLILKV